MLNNISRAFYNFGVARVPQSARKIYYKYYMSHYYVADNYFRLGLSRNMFASFALAINKLASVK